MRIASLTNKIIDDMKMKSQLVLFAANPKRQVHALRLHTYFSRKYSVDPVLEASRVAATSEAQGKQCVRSKTSVWLPRQRYKIRYELPEPDCPAYVPKDVEQQGHIQSCSTSYETTRTWASRDRHWQSW